MITETIGLYGLLTYQQSTLWRRCLMRRLW